MKKGIIFLLMMVFATITLTAQEQLQNIDSVYIAGSVETVTPEFDSKFDGSKMYDGVVGFMFDVTNYVDTLTVLIFEGGYEGLNGSVSYTPIDTLTELNGSITYEFNQAPPVYQKYRLRAPFVSGDTSTISNIIYFEKVSK